MAFSYTISVGIDQSTFTAVQGGKVYNANVLHDLVERVDNFFPVVEARYVRLIVVSWEAHITMRAGVYVQSSYGCPNPERKTFHCGILAQTLVFVHCRILISP